MTRSGATSRWYTGDPRPGTGSGREVAGEGFLLVGLDRTFAVRGADPGHGFVWRLAAEDGKTGQGGPGATVAAVAADLDALTSPGSVEQRFEYDDDQRWVAGDAEIGPVQVVVGPRRLPPLVEVQPEVRGHVAGVGLGAAEGHRCHLRAVGEHDTAAVEVRVESAVLVGRVRARRLLGIRVPERPALVAHDDDSGIGHVVNLCRWFCRHPQAGVLDALAFSEHLTELRELLD